MKECIEKTSTDVNKDIKIQSADSFLHDYWNIFFYLYTKILLDKFKAIKSCEYKESLLDSVTYYDIFKDNRKDLFILGNGNNDAFNFNNYVNTNFPMKIPFYKIQENNSQLINSYLNYGYPGNIENIQNMLAINQINPNNNINLINNCDINPFGGNIQNNMIENPANINNNLDLSQIPCFFPAYLSLFPNTLVYNNIFSNPIIVYIQLFPNLIMILKRYF